MNRWRPWLKLAAFLWASVWAAVAVQVGDRGWEVLREPQTVIAALVALGTGLLAWFDRTDVNAETARQEQARGNAEADR